MNEDGIVIPRRKRVAHLRIKEDCLLTDKQLVRSFVEPASLTASQRNC
jgi:hypothetical protein